MQTPCIPPPEAPSDSIGASPLPDTGYGPEALETPRRGFPTDARIREYLRAKGLTGKITDKFVHDTVWHLLGHALGEALQEPNVFGSGAAGAQEFIDQLLGLGSPEAAAALPKDDPFRVFAGRVMELLNARLDAEIGVEFSKPKPRRRKARAPV